MEFNDQENYLSENKIIFGQRRNISLVTDT